MICPSCGKKISRALPHNKKISETQDLLYGICQYCKEVIFIVYDFAGNTSYGWNASKEARYKSNLSILNNKRNILFINNEVENLFDIILKFEIQFGSDFGIITIEKNKEQSEKIKNIYDIVVLEELLFPVTPSYLAEKMISETLPGKLFSLVKTLQDNFEVWRG